MGFITRYGSFWGMIPQTSGRVFWVAPAASYTVEGRTYTASDNNDGLSPERAVLTVDYAIGLTTANVGDVIVLLPGSHSVAATITVDVAGITITGIPRHAPLLGSVMNAGPAREYTRIVSTETAGIVFTVTAADVEISYIHFDDIINGQNISVSNAADRAFIHDCTFLLDTADSTSTMGITFPLGTGTTTANDDSIVRNCYFRSDSNTGPHIRAAGTVLGLMIENSTFELRGNTALDDSIEITLAGSLGTKIRDCDWVQNVSGTVITDCVEVTGVTTDGSTLLYRCYAPAGSDLVEATATADAYAAECYLATTTGGALTGSA